MKTFDPVQNYTPRMISCTESTPQSGSVVYAPKWVSSLTSQVTSLTSAEEDPGFDSGHARDAHSVFTGESGANILHVCTHALMEKCACDLT